MLVWGVSLMVKWTIPKTRHWYFEARRSTYGVIVWHGTFAKCTRPCEYVEIK